jgi:RNA recognition motif-containing protein
MNSHSYGGRQRHGRGRPRRRSGRGRFQEQRPQAPKQKTFWGDGGGQRKPAPQSRNGQERPQQQQQREREPRPQRKPESVEVTSPRLYVGNLSFDATESDLFELFNGVGHVQNAEVVSYRHNQRSKGFAFVSMQTIDEAKRAVEELHDKEFLGRKLVVSGAKSSEHSHD